ncbi:MAG: lysozyme [Tepidisphaeraceae bacterium]
MRASSECKELIHHFESCALTAYPDPKTGGVPWTIGWGHTVGVKKGDTCTREQADEWFLEDLIEKESGVTMLVAVPLDQCEFDALVSFAYNVGLDIDEDTKAEGLGDSTLLKKLNAGNRVGAADEFLKWVSPGSSVERGLRRRRRAERAMFLGGDWRAELARVD